MESYVFRFSCKSAENKSEPDHDRVLCKNDIFAVVDGIKALHVNQQPNPSPAVQVAKNALHAIAAVLTDERNGIASLRQTFTLANKKTEGSKEEHVYVREQMVNKGYDFGVLNGDPKAKDFLHVGATDVKSGQVAFFYTDGFIPFVYDKEFVKTVFEAKNEAEIKNYIETKEATDAKYKKEKGLIVLKF